MALRKLFERLGATYIKLGQFVASSPSLFPKEYVLEFQKCLDSTEPLEWNVVQSIIEKEVNRQVASIAYPVGGSDHFTIETQEIVREARYRLGFSYNTGINGWMNISPYEIRRVDAHDEVSMISAMAILPRIFVDM